MTRAERECEGPHHREHDDHQSLPVHAGPSDPAYGHHHTYDLAGNRTEVWENGAPVANLSYNDANQVIGWSYDAAGNLLSDGTSSRSYDALNRLVAQAGTSYTYNGDGVLVSDGTTTYAQDLAAPLSQVLTDGTANYLYGHDRLRALGGPWYVGDALGSVRQTLDDAGGVVGSVQYDPWGVPTAGTPQPFGFTGELHSAGQVYLRARWYAPGQGRFVSEDPFAGFPEIPYSLHAYQYGYSNPVRWTDPTGENPLACVPIALVDSPVPGPADVVAGGCLVLVGSIWLVGTLVALTQRDAVADVGNSLVAPHTGHPAPAPPPLASGPPATSEDDIGACVVPGGTTLLPPDTGIWLGPSFIPQPWPLTTGAPGEQVDEPLVWMVNVTGSPKDIAGNTQYLPTQPRVSKSVVQSYAEELINDPDTFWRQFNFPIEITVAPNGTFITDGHHRFLAMKVAGLNFPEDVPPGQSDILPPQSHPFPQPYGRDPWKHIWQWDDVQWGP